VLTYNSEKTYIGKSSKRFRRRIMVTGPAGYVGRVVAERQFRDGQSFHPNNLSKGHRS
jgi:hypothetical protein